MFDLQLRWGWVDLNSEVVAGRYLHYDVRHKYMFFRATPSIKKVTRKIEREIKRIARQSARERVWVTHYGANDFHPRHLVFWICVKTDEEKNRLATDTELNQSLRQLLVDYDYPEEGRDGVHIGFESEETVDRESNGDWRVHWQ